METPQPSRRRFLTGLTGLVGAAAGATALSACGDNTSDTNESAGTDGGPADQTGGFVLLQNFPASGYLVAGSPQRIPFLIAGTDGAPLDKIDGPVELTVKGDGANTAAETVTVSCTPRSAGLPRAYLPLEITFDIPGQYSVSGTYKGSKIDAGLEVGAAGSTALPQRGEVLPPADTPTTVDARGVDPICTREPVCDLHAVNLGDSLAAKRPVAVLIGTPAFCQTAICGPVLDLIIDAARTTKDIDLIHAEVYANPYAVPTVAAATAAPIVTAYDLPFEPMLFVVDAEGVIVDRFDSIFDRDQLDTALAAATA